MLLKQDDLSLIVHCQTGDRSSIAASVLQHHGIENIADLVGGMVAWEAANLPMAASGGTRWASTREKTGASTHEAAAGGVGHD
jgi:3-mercaptopyruvate sulfurtransferase SseA